MIPLLLDESIVQTFLMVFGEKGSAPTDPWVNVSREPKDCMSNTKNSVDHHYAWKSMKVCRRFAFFSVFQPKIGDVLLPSKKTTIGFQHNGRLKWSDLLCL